MKAVVNRWRFVGVLGLSLAMGVGLTAVGWALQGGGDAVQFRPVPDRKTVSLPRGDVLLFQLLQSLADATGVSVYYKGDDPPETMVNLPRALNSLDAKTAGEILEASGFGLSDVEYRGKQVHWVQRNLTAPRQKGKILRGGEAKEGENDAPAGTDRDRGSSATVQEPGSSTVGLYTREEGSGARFVVIFETASRKEAEEAISLLKAQRRARANTGTGR